MDKTQRGVDNKISFVDGKIKKNFIQPRMVRHPKSVERLEASGSNRVYYRLCGDKCPEGSVVGVVGQSADENNAFIKITQHFTLRKLPVPHIFAVAKDGMRYLQTDLGNRTLYEALQKGRNAGWEIHRKKKENFWREPLKLFPNFSSGEQEGLISHAVIRNRNLIAPAFCLTCTISSIVS